MQLTVIIVLFVAQAVLQKVRYNKSLRRYKLIAQEWRESAEYLKDLADEQTLYILEKHHQITAQLAEHQKRISKIETQNNGNK